MTEKTLKELLGELDEFEKEGKTPTMTRPKRATQTSLKLLAALASVFIAGVVVAAVIIGSQSFPAISPPGMTLNCTNLTASQATVVAGSNGKIAFTCGAIPALVVSSTGLFTPTFAKPTGYSNTTLIVSGTSASSSCSTTVNAIPIATGVVVNIGVNTYFYCFDYQNAPASGLAALTVQWSQ